MAFNGSGTYVLPGAALVDGGTVSATEHNALRNDLATALTTCVTRDGQSPATANLPMGGFKLTGLAAGTGTGDSARYDELNAHITDSTDAHAASAITNTPAGTIAATTVQAAINELDTEKASDSAVVKLTGDQTVAGIKTFSSAIVGSTNSQVSLTGDQTVAGIKTFSSPVGVAAAAAAGDAVQASQVLGIDQTWQDVAGSRAKSTTYTNSTGKPIEVKVSVVDASGGINFYINGSIAQAAGTGASGGNFVVGAIIPNGSTYSVVATGAVSKWWELRA